MAKAVKAVELTLALAASSNEPMAAGRVFGNVLTSAMRGNTPGVGCGADHFQSSRQYQ